MLRGTSAVETEIKLRVRSAAAARRMLRAAGFRVIQPRALESNTLFDTPGASLRGRGLLVRLRSFAGRRILTYKGPAKLSAGKRKGSVHRSRIELETEIADPSPLIAVWTALGLAPSFRYEKFRSEWARPGDRAGTAMLDETPIGDFLELEGSSSWIDRVASLLGFQPADYIQASYAALQAEECARRGKPFSDMMFRGTKHSTRAGLRKRS
jgi:adenylate cyclase class 2